MLLDGKLNPDTQVTQFQTALAQGVDGIVVFPLDPNALAPMIKKARQQGVPVIAIEANAENPTDIGDLDSQILEGTDRLAYEQVKQVAQRLEPGAGVVQVTLATPAPVIRSLAEHQRKWIERFGLKLLGTVESKGDDIAAGEQAGSEVFTRFPDAQAVLPYIDSVAIGISAAARQAGKRDVLIFSNFGGTSDGFEAIRSGRLYGTVAYPHASLGRYAAWGLADLIADPDAEMPKAVVAAPPESVTKENVDAVAAKLGVE